MSETLKILCKWAYRLGKVIAHCGLRQWFHIPQLCVNRFFWYLEWRANNLPQHNLSTVTNQASQTCQHERKHNSAITLRQITWANSHLILNFKLKDCLCTQQVKVLDCSQSNIYDIGYILCHCRSGKQWLPSRLFRWHSLPHFWRVVKHHKVCHQ